MALLFMDSFDHYVTADLLTKWTISYAAANITLSINSTGGRRSSGSFRISDSNAASGSIAGISKTLGSVDPTCIIGVAYNCANIGVANTNGMPIITIRDGGTTQLTLRINNGTSTLSVVRGDITGTVLGTTSPVLSSGVYAYIELKALIHPSAGTVDVRVNGASVLSLTAQNTRNSANSTWNVVALGPIAGVGSVWVSMITTFDFDDFYVLDGTGSAPWNDFLGDCRVDARFPTAAGATTGWTPSTGSNWQNVDDAAPNADTDYNSATIAGLTDTFTTQDSPVVGATIYGIQQNINVKKTDTGIGTIAPVIRHSGTDNVGASISPSTSYSYGIAVNQTNPGTGVAWTEAGFNAAEFGYKRLT